MFTGNSPIVLDNGSSLLKAGFARENRPRVIVPSLLACPKYAQILTDVPALPFYIGQDALNKRGICKLKYPMKYGSVQDSEGLQLLWDHVISGHMGVNSRNHPVLVTEATLAPPVNREALAELMFESLEFPAAFVAYQSVLALYASARTTGLVIECGDGTTCVTPIYDTYHLRRATRYHPVAGILITNYLKRLLTETGYRFYTTAEHEIVREIKERACYVAVNVVEACNNAIRTLHTLPDGRILELTDQTFRAPELLFNSQWLGIDYPGLAEVVRASLQMCPNDLRKDLLGNIVLSGGTTLFDGFLDRLRCELQPLGSYNVPVNISAPPGRINQVWIGGSILASLESFRKMWVTKQQYDEIGARALQFYRDYLSKFLLP